MRKSFLSLATAIALFQTAMAQNTSPYWSLAGNSNTTTSSKLGTTNGVSLRFFANNVQRMLIGYSSGNVAIGTNTLTARLNVNAATGAAPLLAQINGATKLFAASNGGLSVGSGTTAPSNGLYVSGSVGIGTAAPEAGYKLHVVGKGRFTTGLYVNDGGLISINTTANGIEGYAGGTYGAGVWGQGPYGVVGQGTMYGVTGDGGNYGVYGTGDSYGVYGEGGVYGVWGSSIAAYGYGVSGQAEYVGVHGSADSYGVYGTSVGWAGYFTGNVYTSGAYFPSARKLKQNITDFDGALAVIAKLQPKEYEYKQDGVYKEMHLPKGKRYGLIAEDLEQVLPGLVRETSFDSRLARKQDTTAGRRTATAASEKIDFKAVNYIELIPVLIKGMQELRTKDEEIDDLKARIATLEAAVSRLLNGQTSTPATGAGSLSQNTPNPASGTTAIRYTVPVTAASARLLITNAKGQVVQTVNLANRGTGQVAINSTQLAAGSYTYSLWVDGKPVETKQLVIAR